MKRRSIITILVIAMITTCLAIPAMASAEESTDAQAAETEKAVEKTVKLEKTTIDHKVVSPQTVETKWKKVKGAHKYSVTLKKGSKVVKKKTTKKTRYTAKNLTKGTKYTFTVKAASKEGATSETNYTLKTPSKITRSMDGFNDTNAGKLIKIAKSKLGCQYVSGGSGPSVFDCSGYVYYITKRSHDAGLTSGKLTRSSDSGELAQMRSMKGAKYVGRSYSKAQPGDIVFFTHPHVAFYYGDGKLIHATNPRTDVTVTSIYWSGGPGSVKAIYRLPEM